MKDFKTYTEGELIKACLKNKRAAQFELYERYSYTMKGVCIRYLTNDYDIDDALQESFIRAFRSLNQYKFDGPFGAWLRKITVNTCLELHRKNNTIKKQMDELRELPNNFVVVPKDNGIIFEQLSAEEIIQKIQLLPIGFRTIFNMYAVEGYTHEEIAKLLTISPGTSKSQYSRARMKLQEMIEVEKKLENRKRYV